MIKAIPRGLSALVLALLLTIGLSTTAFAAERDTVGLNTPDAGVNAAFAVDNMFPGDAETKDFTVKVDHKKPITLYYHADIRPGSEKLAEVMMLRVELPDKGETLYDGLMRDMPPALEHQLAGDEDRLTYRLTAYLDTSVSNDYQFKTLVADFRWWYLEEDDEDLGGGGGSISGGTTVDSNTWLKLVGEKILDGQYPRGRDFTFLLTDEAGRVLQTVKNQDGLIEFESIRVDADGIYTYYITEQPGGDPNMQYDPARYTVTATATSYFGQRTVTTVWEKDGQPYTVLPRFVNTSGDQPLPELPEQPGQPGQPDVPTPPADPDNPKTGDDSPIGLYAGMLGVSAAGMILLLLTRKKKEDADHG